MNYIEKLINWNFLIFANNVFLFVVFPLITTMKGLKMGARMESFRYINVIFLCVFIYIWISDIFFTFSNENPIAFRINFKSLISKCPNYTKILTFFVSLTVLFGQSTMLILSGTSLKKKRPVLLYLFMFVCSCLDTSTMINSSF